MGDIAFPPNDHVVTRRILERHAVQRPDSLAVVGPTGETWTWAEALRTASHLRSLGVAPGDRVLLFLPNGLKWLRAWLGDQLSGCGDGHGQYRLPRRDPASGMRRLGVRR